MIQWQPDPVASLRKKVKMFDLLIGLTSEFCRPKKKESSVGEPLAKIWFKLSGGTSCEKKIIRSNQG